MKQGYKSRHGFNRQKESLKACSGINEYLLALGSLKLKPTSRRNLTNIRRATITMKRRTDRTPRTRTDRHSPHDRVDELLTRNYQ